MQSVLLATLFLGHCAAAWGVEFAGGTGEPNDPYQIATPEQLIAIGSDPNLARRHFILTASIDLSGMVWSSPVIPSFYGSLDGNGHTIRGLKARVAGPMGLFGRIESSGRIMDVHLTDVDVTGAGGAGALAAENAGVIRDCRCDGQIIGTGSYAGGLAGLNSGTITGSFSAAEVIGSVYVGGLVGRNQGGILVDCHSASVVLGSSNVGGLVGSNEGSVSASYSDSEVIGSTALGGLSGGNAGGLSFCYATGTVAGGTSAGGLVGSNTGKVFSCYSTASVTAQSVPGTGLGGLVGTPLYGSSPLLADSYFLTQADGGGPDNLIGTPLTATQMMQQASFVGWDFWGTDADGNDSRWFMPAGSPPVLVWQTEVTGLQRVPDVTGLSLDQARATLTAAGFVPDVISYDFHRTLPVDYVICADPYSVAPIGGTVGLVASSGPADDWSSNPGDGTAAKPYEILTAGQLESLGDHPELWDRHFVLIMDVDMVGRTYSTALIAPNADDATTGFQGTPFTGVFDGQGRTIRNLTIEAGDRDYAGLFGMVEKAGRVSGLHLLDAIVRIPTTATSSATRPVRPNLTSATYAGVLVAYNYGSIADCSAMRGIVIARSSENGLVGLNRGTMTNCTADVTVIRVSYAIR